jgi:hypothetical protein
VARTIVLLFAFLASVVHASGDEWSSRNGVCYEWEGRWAVQQTQPGLWMGDIDFAHVGGECSRYGQGPLTNEVQAVMIGDVFFARRSSASSSCYMHGKAREGGVAGYEMCTGNPNAYPFAVRFSLTNPRQ